MNDLDSAIESAFEAWRMAREMTVAFAAPLRKAFRAGWTARGMHDARDDDDTDHEVDHD